jgi:hypothetical protein
MDRQSAHTGTTDTIRMHALPMAITILTGLTTVPSSEPVRGSMVPLGSETGAGRMVGITDGMAVATGTITGGIVAGGGVAAGAVEAGAVITAGAIAADTQDMDT